jgi:hypothetical protein
MDPFYLAVVEQNDPELDLYGGCPCLVLTAQHIKKKIKKKKIVIC